jgi:hypothetical protein
MGRADLAAYRAEPRGEAQDAGSGGTGEKVSAESSLLNDFILFVPTLGDDP